MKTAKGVVPFGIFSGSMACDASCLFTRRRLHVGPMIDESIESRLPGDLGQHLEHLQPDTRFGPAVVDGRAVTFPQARQGDPLSTRYSLGITVVGGQSRSNLAPRRADPQVQRMPSLAGHPTPLRRPLAGSREPLMLTRSMSRNGGGA